MHRLFAICSVWLLLAGVIPAASAETLPSKPANYFNDFVSIVPATAASELDEKLRQFERDTSNQIVVAIFPKLESNSSVQDFTYRVAESWGVGQKDRNNGAVLFVFVADHKLFIQVGYGLEAVLPDAICKRIIAEQIQPAFRAGNYEQGLRSAVDSMIAATKGEYRGTGNVAGGTPVSGGIQVLMFFGLFAVVFIIGLVRNIRQGTVYTKSGRKRPGGIFWGSGGSGGGGFGGGSSGGGGGFSGGGGSFGGGGAGGSW